ncbi:diguanylate cyclase [Neptuniibacter sp. SY11_33]|uniref:diguanylate cyclase n=1 Tax=Neptuniibacter sp. SY11_33 TaxID=3398215 RepID=UPI0039F50476
MLQYTVYADLNCPFCYALHEQLHQFGLLQQVDWRLVEHAPDIAIFNKTAESQAELASEVFVVRSRVPNIEVALPKARSDSHFASLCVIEAAEHDVEKSILLRRLLYRALWVEGKDIADVSVIYDCLMEAGLPTELDIEEPQENKLIDWQNAWEQGDFNLRIPVICADDGRISLGLPSPEDLKAFFKGKEIDSQDQHRESCPRSEQQTIAIYCDHSIEIVWPVIAILRNDYNILLPANLTELKNLLQEDAPDLLLLGTENQWSDMFALCEEVNKNKDEFPLPIAFLSQQVEDQLELDAYQAGAADFLALNRTPAVIQSRIKILMHLKQSQDQLARSARVDGLTQVNNRREFERNIETEWRRAQRSKRNLSLIMLDIDHFKLFNDGYGHLAGDGCLRTIAQTIKASIQRAQDMVCRYGGEEFAVILPETDIDGAQLIAERIRSAIAELKIEHKFSSTGDTATVSAGVASINPSKGGSPHELIELADQALYQSKQNGRNRVTLS